MTKLSQVHQPGRRAINEQLVRILESSLFANSRRRQRFLEYIVMETVAGRGDRLKGYCVALEVFDRAPSFDPVADPIVRVEAARLREKLREYYEFAGQNDPVLIEIPKGSYKPSITLRQPQASNTTKQPVGVLRDSAIQTVRGRMLGTQDRAAYQEMLSGLDTFWRYSREACAEAQKHFGRAAEFDPDCAPAHAWLARTHVWQACMNWAPDRTGLSSLELAERHGRRAIELDDQLPLAHSIFGKVQLCLDDSETAVLEARKACALDPNSGEPKMFLSFILATTGHGEEALFNIRTAIGLQPHPSSYYFETLGLSYFALGDYDRAIGAFLHGIEINPAYMPCRYELAVTYGLCGYDEAAESEAALVKADWPHVSTEFIADRRLAETYFRGKKAAGLD